MLFSDLFEHELDKFCCKASLNELTKEDALYDVRDVDVIADWGWEDEDFELIVLGSNELFDDVWNLEKKMIN